MNSQEQTRYCVFDKGPWGDMNTDNPLCTVKITAKMVDYPNDRQALLDTNSKLLKWDGATRSSQDGIRDERILYWIGGTTADRLECFGVVYSSLRVDYSCSARTLYQQYPRVER